MRRRISKKGWLAQTGGVALIAVGGAAFALGLSTDIQIAGGQPVALTLGGAQAMTVGVILFCYQQLLIRSSRNEDALRFQYDIGYEAGWQECEKTGRPVVVDLSARRPCPCGSGKAQKTAAKVSDRV